MSDEDNEFIKGVDAGSACGVVEAGRSKPGTLVMMKETFPCKVTAMNTAKPGKHGSAKAMIVAKDIFTDKQYEESFGTGDMIGAPIVTKTEYLLLDLDDSQLTLMHQESGDIREDIDLPTEKHLQDVVKLLKTIKDADKRECLVTVQHFDNREQVISVREGNDQ